MGRALQDGSKDRIMPGQRINNRITSKRKEAMLGVVPYRASPTASLGSIFHLVDWCIVCDGSRCNQGTQNNACFATIDNIMITVAQHCTASAGWLHGSGVRIGRGDLLIGNSLVMWFADTVEAFAIVFGNQCAEG